MASLDEVFYKEFRSMLQERKALSGAINLYDIQLPPDFEKRNQVSKHHKVIIRNVQEDYYKLLNESEVMLWSKPKLESRKFASDGSFLRDSKGNYIKKEVTLPNNCAAVISDKRIGVPLKFKSKEGFQYVDYIERTVGDKKVYRYIYIIPKKYCFKLNQVALVISFTKLKKFYCGFEMALQNGNVLYMYIINHRVTSVEQSFRTLCTKTDFSSFSEEISELNRYWMQLGMLFNRVDTELTDSVKGRTNVAYMEFDATLDEYVRFDPEKSLADDKESEDDIEIDF